MISRRKFTHLAGSAGLIAGAGALGAKAAEAPSIQVAAPASSGPPELLELMEIPFMADAAVSPDGKTIVVLRQTAKYRSLLTNDNFSAFLTFRNADTLADESTTVLGKMQGFSVDWLDNDRVLVHVTNFAKDASNGRSFGSQAGDGVFVMHKVTRTAMFLPPGSVVDRLPKDPDHIIMQKPDRGASTLQLVNTRDGTSKEIERGLPMTTRWYIQDGKAVMRVDKQDVDAKVLEYYSRQPGKTDWKLVGRWYNNSVIGNDFDILGSSVTKPGVLLVASNAEGENYRPLREYDVATQSWGEVISRQNGDAVACVTDFDGSYVATAYIDDVYAYDCADHDLTTDLATLTGAFPDASLTIRNISRDRQRMVCRVSGPHNAGSYIFYDRMGSKVRALGDARPWLTTERLPTVKNLSVRTKDGVLIRAYLTVPVGGGKKPLVVMPHGGPQARDKVQFDMWAQSVAAKGWYVLQPNFRGSGGYGKAFTDAGLHQWNGVIMDDIEMCVAYALVNYPIDRERVAVCGASFGGYAALMSAVRNPTLYKAVVSMDGVSDLPQILERERTDSKFNNTLSYDYWRRTIGDPVADKDMLDHASPAKRAAEINAPVLLVHGTSDQTVNIEQSRIMAAALRAAKKTVEVQEVPLMGHGPSSWDDTKNVFGRITDFLSTHLA